MRGGLPALALLALLGCARLPESPETAPYEPTRRDYATFAAAWADLLEPNYLPFMAHRHPRDDPGGDLLFFCRWPDEAMPLAVHVVPPEIREELQDEFAPREAAAYVRAVERALRTWERALEGLVSFRRAAEPARAALTVRVVGERAPEPAPELQVLGTTRLTGACRVVGLDPDAERLEVRFAVPELTLFVADAFGLLSPDQVEFVALHEIGHALGMRGHSPIPADLMFEVARDRISVVEGLSQEDVNSFVSLYRLPNGTIFGRVGGAGAGEGPVGPGPPRLALAPYVDARHGFEFHPPGGWTRVPTAKGMAAVDGTTWDYLASFQVVVHRYATIEDFLDRYGGYYLRRGSLTRPADVVVSGRRALQVEIRPHDAPRVEQVTLVEVGDGRLLAITADCPEEAIADYRPWFEASLATFRITELPEEAWPGPRRRREAPAPPRGAPR